MNRIHSAIRAVGNALGLGPHRKEQASLEHEFPSHIIEVGEGMGKQLIEASRRCELTADKFADACRQLGKAARKHGSSAMVPRVLDAKREE